ncbi:MaoC/PaaZ C-terminal domain-containing protein [Mycobacterium vicinigordonae]|uniref:MaoC family dehydratase N-terminal domain-containing protein n=1 Tax=Mycobacterium vicinigordonae TaxID=1719132 RepID=A0A7D6HW91_9MYCO|nr:MaoC/PaaZ C-terminal domain-containing protein [Mycobacterium vicinigordonae]QLL08932.1 MaoC family dehydratase N-terminal domain-containing protein [Mycobacterium vicinigordonae]
MVLTESVVGTALSPKTFRWNQTDVILYALGVGARPPAELPLLNELAGPAVLPTFALIANWWAVKDLRSVLDLGAYPIVHSAQSLELYRPIGPTGELSVQARVSALWDTGKHAAVELTGQGTDADGTAFVTRSQTVVLGAGGFGGERRPSAEPDPEDAPDSWYDDVVRPEQAAIYRLSGDRNQLHIDPAAARKFGFDDVFLHGLCTLGFAARALINEIGGANPQRLTSLSCRFAKPVRLGAPLRTEMWRSGQDVRFRTLQGDVVALSSGSATLAGG